MRTRNPAGNQRGFSMIEVMVSAGLLAVAVLGLASQMKAQKGFKGAADTAEHGRRAMTGVVDALIASPYRFPAFENAGKGIVYVGCFDSNGGPIASDPAAPIPGLKDFQGVWSIDPTNQGQFVTALTAGNLVCTQTAGQATFASFEVHVASAPADAGGAVMSIAAIALPVAGSSIQQSSIPIFSTQVRLGGVPSIPAKPVGWPAGLAAAQGQWCGVAGNCTATCDSQNDTTNQSPNYFFCR